MNAETLRRLNRINQQFYQKYAHSFSRTRQTIQPGVLAILESIADNGRWLDIGCGNGGLARAWVHKGYTGLYYGVDLSAAFIKEASARSKPSKENQKITFCRVDLNSKNWTASLPDVKWDAVFCFAVLHHIPGSAQRQLICRQLRELLPSSGRCFLSVWQLRNSPRLEKRILSWESVGISSSDVDPGDVLMDWRAHYIDGRGEKAFRYVHIFTEDELTALAQSSDFSVVDGFYSDGKEGKLALYQRWE